MNLRVDDHPEPPSEQKTLININQAYIVMNDGDSLLVKNRIEAARGKYSLASEMAPYIEELPFWQAVTLTETGGIAEALPIFKKIIKKNPDRAELVELLPDSGSLINKPVLIVKILSVLDY